MSDSFFHFKTACHKVVVRKAIYLFVVFWTRWKKRVIEIDKAAKYFKNHDADELESFTSGALNNEFEELISDLHRIAEKNGDYI